MLIAGLSLRWRIFLLQQSLELPRSTVLCLTWAGQFFNSVLPGSTGGDVVKIYQLCRLFPDQKPAAAASVFADRVSALLALLVLAGGAALIEPAPLCALARQWHFERDTVMFAIASITGIITLGTWLLWRALRSTEWPGRFRRTLAALTNSVTWNWRLVAALSLAFGLHLLTFLTVFVFARALGLGLSYGKTLLMMSVVQFLVLIPVTINGHGLRELLFIAYFSQMSIAPSPGSGIGVQELVVALSLLLVANDLLWSLLGGILYLFMFGNLKVNGPKRRLPQ